MKVKFTTTWFAPTFRYENSDRRTFTGRRFLPGVHEVPSELKDVLPKTAVIVEDKDAEEVKPVRAPSLRDFDIERANADEMVRIAEEVNKNTKAK